MGARAYQTRRAGGAAARGAPTPQARRGLGSRARGGAPRRPEPAGGRATPGRVATAAGGGDPGVRWQRLGLAAHG